MAAYGVLELADLHMICQKPATRTPEVEFSDKFETTGTWSGEAHGPKRAGSLPLNPSRTKCTGASGDYCAEAVAVGQGE